MKLGGDFQTILLDLEDHVATITLNRPEKLNAFNQLMGEEMTAAYERIRDDDGIRVAIIQANGDRAFCSGLDVKEGAWWAKDNVWNQVDPGGFLGAKHHKVWKPVIVAIHGMCAGGAQYFVNDADIVICSEEATFFDPHANIGAVSALEPIGLLYRGLPLGDVLRWALMGNEERITAQTALRLGLVSEVVARNDLRLRAREIADGIAKRRPEAVQGTIRAIWEALEMTRSMALQNGMSYTHIGNPRPGEPRSVYALDKRTESR